MEGAVPLHQWDLEHPCLDCGDFTDEPIARWAGKKAKNAWAFGGSVPVGGGRAIV